VASTRDRLELTLVQPRRWDAAGDANFAEIRRLLARPAARPSAGAVIVLPELVGSSMRRADYVAAVGDLARATGSWVVGGSHHWTRRGRTRNAGVVAGPDGEVAATYEKRHPFGVELDRSVDRGDGPAVVDVGGVRVGVMICADFWHSECIRELEPHPDVIAVASFSISRQRAPGAAKELWRHLAVTRAWEHGVHVGISAPSAADFSRSSTLIVLL
jgi:predicted amidohydrolase